MNNLDQFAWLRELEKKTRENVVTAREVEGRFLAAGYPPIPKPAILILAEQILLDKK